MWICPKCQTSCETTFCPTCGTKKPEVTTVDANVEAQLKKLAKSVKTTRVICIILLVAVIALSVALVLVYNSIWENVVDLWENVEDLWENAEELWESSEELWMCV